MMFISCLCKTLEVGKSEASMVSLVIRNFYHVASNLKVIS